VLIFYGWVRRPILIGTKRDFCATCGDVKMHGIIRVATIATLFWIPIIPLWISHSLICEECGTRRKLGWRQVRAAMSSGVLPMPPRPDWPAYARRVFEETNRTPRESELDRIEKNAKRGPWDLYLKAWIVAVPSVIAGLIISSLIP
jgi:hypothetical protein